jgi:ADP-ribosyl-[dinitrogen reductase] hydrolase
LIDKYTGSLVGLACGDALGSSVEFQEKGKFNEVTEMIGGGVFNLPPGFWTDDTSMMLCLAASLVTCQRFDAMDQMERYCRWMDEGYFSSTGICFDIGNTTRYSLLKFQKTGDPFSGPSIETTSGNGSLMRLAPIALFYYPKINEIINYSAESSRTTHASTECVESCQILGSLIGQILLGENKANLLDNTRFNPKSPKLVELIKGDFVNKTYDEIYGLGYVIKTLEAALWCFFNTNTFEDALVTAVNLGDDADTVGAVVGQIAGAYYGYDEIPKKWINKLYMHSEIRIMAEEIFEVSKICDI